MTKDEILTLAEKYLTDRKSRYISPGKLGRTEGNKIEAIFLKPEALDLDVVIDPPDIRVWVDTKTRVVQTILQM